MTSMTKRDARKRIIEIDNMIAQAKSWGSWMSSAANEREDLARIYGLPHRYQIRNSDGSRTD